MLRLQQLRQILKNYGLTVESTGRGKHPFKVQGMVMGTERQHTYPLKVHGKNPVENLSKRYRLGQRERYYALRDVLARALTAPFR